MKCPKCQTDGYHYKDHAFWQCPNSTCGHAWKDEAPAPVEPLIDVDATAIRRKKRNRALAHLGEFEAAVAGLHPSPELAFEIAATVRTLGELVSRIPVEVAR